MLAILILVLLHLYSKHQYQKIMLLVPFLTLVFFICKAINFLFNGCAYLNENVVSFAPIYLVCSVALGNRLLLIYTSCVCALIFTVKICANPDLIDESIISIAMSVVSVNIYYFIDSSMEKAIERHKRNIESNYGLLNSIEDRNRDSH
jgi:hypothetical protein